MVNTRQEEIINWLKANYDKLVLVIVLGAILISLLVLIFSAGREKKSLAGDLLEQTRLAGAKQKYDGLPAAFFNAIENVSAPFQIGNWTTRMVVAELRVNCVKCGQPIPGEAETCPFCGAPQPNDRSIVKDSDSDRMPDEWEIKQGLNPNLNDAAQDNDNDGFSNLEEYLAGTDPKDEASAPPPVDKLYVLKTARILFPLMFGGAQQVTTNAADLIFLVKNRRTGRDSYLRIGKTIEGYKITGYEPRIRKVNRGVEIQEDISVLKLSKDGKNIELVRGDKSGLQDEWAASLIYLLDNTKMVVRKGDIIKLKNSDYKVIDITNRNVKVTDMQSGKEMPLKPFKSSDK